MHKLGRLDQVFCSQKCNYEYRRQNPVPSPLKGTIRPNLYRARVGNCEECGKEYRATADYKTRKQKYCGMECAQKAWTRDKQPDFRRLQKGEGRIGEDNPEWKGDFAGYSAMHKWVMRKKGKPSECEHCGTTKAKKFEWANIDHTYRRDVDDYIRLCTSCHRKHDISNGLV